jgi:hypothetical protein
MGNCGAAIAINEHQTASLGKNLDFQDDGYNIEMNDPINLSRSQKNSLTVPILPIICNSDSIDEFEEMKIPHSSTSSQGLKEADPAPPGFLSNFSKRVMIVSSDFKTTDLGEPESSQNKFCKSKLLNNRPQSLSNLKSMEGVSSKEVSAIGKLHYAAKNAFLSPQSGVKSFALGSDMLARRLGVQELKKSNSDLDEKSRQFRLIFDSIDTDKDGRISAMDMMKLVNRKTTCLEDAELSNKLLFLELAVRDATNNQRDYWTYEDFKRYFTNIASGLDNPLRRN